MGHSRGFASRFTGRGWIGSGNPESRRRDLCLWGLVSLGWWSLRQCPPFLWLLEEGTKGGARMRPTSQTSTSHLSTSASLERIAKKAMTFKRHVSVITIIKTGRWRREYATHPSPSASKKPPAADGLVLRKRLKWGEAVLLQSLPSWLLSYSE